MPDITSVSNQQIKDAVKLQQKKHRISEKLFLLEGYKPIFEAFESNVAIKIVYTLEKNLQKFNFLKDKIVTVNEAVLEKLSTTDSMPEAVAIGHSPCVSIEEIKGCSRIVLLENIKDGGNLGTVTRSAAAFGMDAVVLVGDTIDPYHPKVVRSAVGALFKLPVVKIASIRDLEFSSHQYIATVLNHKEVVNPETLDYKNPFVLMFGSEAEGLSQDAIDMAQIKTTIPISNRTESLNLSTAASIMFYIARD